MGLPNEIKDLFQLSLLEKIIEIYRTLSMFLIKTTIIMIFLYEN